MKTGLQHPLCLWLALASLAGTIHAAEPALPPVGPPAPLLTNLTAALPSQTPSNPAVETREILRAYLHLQEQMHAALLAIEQDRREAATATARNEQAVSERLRVIEEQFSQQRSRELDVVQHSNRSLLILASLFAGLALLAMIAASWLQLRTVNRLAEIASAFPGQASHTLSPPHFTPALGPGQSSTHETEQAGSRLRHALRNLENRVRELEHTPHSGQRPKPELTPRDGQSQTDAPTELGVPPDSQASPHSLLLGKGQALLHLNDAEGALACFDRVLTEDPDNTEALLKKGTALERLKKPEEAIECYDRAIALNDSVTLAYLYKGGVYNQLERFDEALQCYEQALRSQQKSTCQS